MLSIRTFVLIAVIAGGPYSTVAQESGNSVAFTHVTVIDCTGGPSKSEMTVVVTGDRIAAVGKTGDVVVPDDAVLVDATNRFLIPGLWDMHVHFRGYSSPLFIANGVTGVRIMFGRSRDIEAREEVKKGNAFIPDRNVASSPFADESFDLRKDRDVIQVKTELGARQAVQAAFKSGFDSIKISSALRRELYVAITEEAKQLGIPFAGHVPESVSAEFASEAGQKSIEHLTGIMIGCSRMADELQELYSQVRQGGMAKEEIRKRAMASYDKNTAERLFAKFVKNNTWQCPTLTVFEAKARADDPAIFQQDRLSLIPEWESNRWNRVLKSQASYADYLRTKFRHRLRVVGAMHAAGVKILAGTDTANPHCYQGSGLHDELELLVRAGLSPMASLQSATRNPAEYFGHLNEAGTIESGKIADLVLLEKDPLVDIQHVRRVSGVVLRGHWVDKAALNQMLSHSSLTAKIENIGGRCKRDVTKLHQPVVDVRFLGQPVTDAQVALVSEFTELEHLGLSSSHITDEGLSIVAKFPKLQQLMLNKTKISNLGLKHVQAIRGLRSLKLAGVPIGNEELARLGKLSKLEQLVLHSTKITDAGLEHVKGFGSLKTLDLSHTQVSDRGLVHLYPLETLRMLLLNETRVSEFGINELKRMLPELEVSYSRTNN